MPELKPCPFCGSSDVAVITTSILACGRDDFVQCNGCASDGPFGKSVSEAAEKWNARSVVPEALRIERCQKTCVGPAGMPQLQMCDRDFVVSPQVHNQEPK